MRHEYYFLFITSCFIFAGCNAQSGRNINESSEIYTIDFEQGFDTEQQMFISEIADSVEYIELKTPDDIVITKIRSIIQADEYLMIHANHDVFLFHKKGQFIRQISARGQGPGEYSMSASIEVDRKKNEIVITDAHQFMFFDFEGNFLRSIKKENFNPYIGISDTMLWIGEVVSSANTKYKTVAISLQAGEDTLAYIHNSLYGIIKSDNIHYHLHLQVNFFYHEKDLLYFKGDMSNDTIWRISGISAKPYAFIDMGKYKMPVEYEPWYSSFETYQKHYDRYWSVCSMVEGNHHFFLLSNWREYAKDGRRDFGAYKTIVYDKDKNKSFAVKDKNGIGFTDDIQGGPPVWPRWSSDDYFINKIETEELLEKVSIGEYTPSPQLKELLSRIDDSSNDLIILMHRKK